MSFFSKPGGNRWTNCSAPGDRAYISTLAIRTRNKCLTEFNLVRGNRIVSDSCIAPSGTTKACCISTCWSLFELPSEALSSLTFRHRRSDRSVALPTHPHQLAMNATLNPAIGLHEGLSRVWTVPTRYITTRFLPDEGSSSKRFGAIVQTKVGVCKSEQALPGK